jgi:hypothetical protein
LDEAVRISRLDREAAAALQLRATAGDPAAARDFVLFSAWKRIEGERRYTLKQRVAALRALCDRVRTVEFAKPGDPDYDLATADALKRSRDGVQPGLGEAMDALLDPDSLPPSRSPWWGDGPPPGSEVSS